MHGSPWQEVATCKQSCGPWHVTLQAVACTPDSRVSGLPSVCVFLCRRVSHGTHTADVQLSAIAIIADVQPGSRNSCFQSAPLPRLIPLSWSPRVQVGICYSMSKHEHTLKPEKPELHTLQVGIRYSSPTVTAGAVCSPGRGTLQELWLVRGVTQGNSTTLQVLNVHCAGCL